MPPAPVNYSKEHLKNRPGTSGRSWRTPNFWTGMAIRARAPLIRGTRTAGRGPRAVARRLAVLDLLAGDRVSAERHLEIYRKAGGTGLVLPATATSEKVTTGIMSIPGPLPSFARMAALSPDLAREDLLPALARNVVTNGYQATNSAEGLDQTEFLKLVVRYLSQARELEKLAGSEKQIHIENCESGQTADLLRVLGYRMRGGLRQRCRARDGECHPRVSHHRFGLPAGGSGAEPPDQPAVPVQLPTYGGPVLYGTGILAHR
jgi:hypothetical protein